MDIYVFDNTLTKMKSVISEDECFEATEVREINKAGQLSLSLILSAKDEVNETDLLAIHKKDDEYYLYRVVKKNLMNDRVEILGLEYGYYSLKYDGYIKDIRPNNESLDLLLPRILSGTDWKKGKIDTKIAPFTGSFYFMKRLDALAEITEKLACEFEFVVTISNNQITSQRVNVLSHLGTHTGKRFEYGINALEVIAESDATSIVTQAIGRGKGEESGDGYGRRIDFSSVEWKKSSGKPVDKPKGNIWVNDPYTNYLMPGRKRALEIVVFEDEIDPEKLLEKTYDWLLQNNRPKVQFKAQVTEVEGLSLGDYVNIIRPDLNIRYETRVFKLTRNLLNENFNEVEFGDNIATTPMDEINTVSNQISVVTDNVQRVDEKIEWVNANGVHVSVGKEEPKNKKRGDFWYKETEDGEIILLQWNGDSWEEIISQKVIEEINITVENAVKESEEAAKKAQQAIEEANLANSNLLEFENETKDQIIKLNGNFNGLQVEVTNLKKDTESSITQLADQVNLSVKKGEVINQINLSTEGILIDGKKVHITGQTVIDNAVIKSSMIQSVKADTITAGTLNAANVKIINLDVNTLTGNKSQFLKTLWSDNNSYSELTPDGLKFYSEKSSGYSKTSYMTLKAASIKWKNDGPSYHVLARDEKENAAGTLTLSSVTNGATEPANFRVKSSGIVNFKSSGGNARLGGEYTFIGATQNMMDLYGSSGSQKAWKELTTYGKGQSIDSGEGYYIQMAAQNKIILAIRSSGEAKSIDFRNASYNSSDSFHTSIVYKNDNSAGMVIKSPPTYSRTYSYSPNVYITSNGYLGRATSARKYKDNIKYIDNLKEAKKVLDIQPAEWSDKKQERAQIKNQLSRTKENVEVLDERYVGFIADDFADAGFEKLVIRGDDGEVEEFQYSRLSVYHHQLIKDLYNQIEKLQLEINGLKGE